MMSLSRKTTRTILAGSLLVVGVLAIALLVWIIYLDRIITAQFEGRRWTLPAQVFAEPLELYVGQSFGAQTLEQELKRLGYRSVDKAEQPGSYSRRGARVELVNRRFQFWDALQEPQLVSIVTRGNSIESMRNGRGEEVPIFRLDPLLIGSIFPIHGEDRVVVTPDQVSPLLPAALKVVEDRKFDSHHGVDYGAIARAAWVNLRAGQIEQGGSTLTQQLVKSYFLDNRRTLGRKIEEAMMAWLLEVHFEKQDLMNSYINEIYLGQDGNRAVHGFGLGSQFYFGKPLAELQLHEVALLVAIVRGPSYYDPRRHQERARARRDLVLKLMAQYKVVDEKAAQEAAKKPLGVVNASTQAGGYYPAFLDLVRRTLRRDYREEDLTEAGLKIFCTLSPAGAEPGREGTDAGARSTRQAAQAEGRSQARRCRGRDGAAERRSGRDGRRPPVELRRLQSRVGRETLDRLAGEAGDLSRRDRVRSLQRGVHRRRRPRCGEAPERHGVGAEEHHRGVSTARCRWCAHSRSR